MIKKPTLWKKFDKRSWKNQKRLQKQSKHHRWRNTTHFSGNPIKQRFTINFKNIELYFKKQQIIEANEFHAHKFYIFDNFIGAISEKKGVLNCQDYDFEEFPHDNVETS